MPDPRPQRVRDPVHGLIVFTLDPLDQLAWALLDTPEMQRLRRIKQLGLSEFVFPGATHSRFAHSIGVFHTARELVAIIGRERPEAVDGRRAEVAVLAAVLHDIGHGPLSHTFEEVQKKRGARKEHEVWSAEIVTDPYGRVRPLLEAYRPGLADEIAELLLAEVPEDIYHAVVSSSFDADRLDYLRRDRLMTGTGAGAIDFDWLLDNLTVEDIDLEVDADTGADVRRLSFCLRYKALQAAETFLLARYQLYTQVYLHKTTRGMEQMMGALLLAVSQKGTGAGLEMSHPLTRFFAAQSPTVTDFLALDDAVLWGAIERLRFSPDAFISKMARRLHDRDLYKGFDLEAAYGSDTEVQRRNRRRIDRAFKNEMGSTVLKDEPNLSIYGNIGADDAKAHQRLMILVPNRGPQEITGESGLIRALEPKRELVRYYFDSAGARAAARNGEPA